MRKQLLKLKIAAAILIALPVFAQTNAATGYDPFKDGAVMAKLCDDLRHTKPSLADSNYYEFEYKMLVWAKVDLENDSAAEIRKKMNDLWIEHAHDLECKYTTNIYPKGNYYRQLPHTGAKSVFLMLLKTYKLDPNIIDLDGCTALDYLNKTIKEFGYTIESREKFKEYRQLLIENGAKTANELGGKC